MKRLALTLLVSLAIGSAAGVAQDAVQQARDEGKEFGKAKRADLKAPSQAQLSEVPGYAGTEVQQSTYFDDPDRLATDGAVQASLLGSMIDNMLDRVTQAQVQFQPADQATAATWRDQLREAREKYSQRQYKLKDTIDVTEKIVNRTMMLESTLQNSMSPGMAASLNFSRGLNAQGLN